MSLTIGTYVQGSILEQLERLEYIQLLEVSLVPTPELEAELRNAGPFGDPAASLATAEGGRRLRLELRDEKNSDGWPEQARSFVKRVLGMPGQEHMTKTLRVTGGEPVVARASVADGRDDAVSLPRRSRRTRSRGLRRRPRRTRRRAAFTAVGRCRGGRCARRARRSGRVGSHRRCRPDDPDARARGEERVEDRPERRRVQVPNGVGARWWRSRPDPADHLAVLGHRPRRPRRR